MVDLLFQRARPASPTPVRSHWPRHEVHGHDEAQWEHSALWVALELLQNVEAGQREKGDASQPEEAAEHGVQQVEEAAQEHGEKPVGQQYGGHQEEGACWRVGERCGAEVVAEV